jgi:uncharacterized membrane protein
MCKSSEEIMTATTTCLAAGLAIGAALGFLFGFTMIGAIIGIGGGALAAGVIDSIADNNQVGI